MTRQVLEALQLAGEDDLYGRSYLLDAILASAPLQEEDVHYLNNLCHWYRDEGESEEQCHPFHHDAVDFRGVEQERVLEHATRQLLFTRSQEMLNRIVLFRLYLKQK